MPDLRMWVPPPLLSLALAVVMASEVLTIVLAIRENSTIVTLLAVVALVLLGAAAGVMTGYVNRHMRAVYRGPNNALAYMAVAAAVAGVLFVLVSLLRSAPA